MDSAAGFAQLGPGVTISTLAPLADIVVPAPLTFEAVESYYGIIVEIVPTTLQGDANFRDNIATTSVGVDVPEAAAGPDQVFYINEEVNLDGSASTAPSGLPLTYLWLIKEKPVGSTCEIVSPTSARASLVTEEPGQYRVELLVRDGQTSDVDEVIITCKPPTVSDVIAGLQVLSGVNPDGIYRAVDMDRDGKTEMEDIMYMIREIAGF